MKPYHSDDIAQLSQELEEARDTIERLIGEKLGITKQRDEISRQFLKAMEENIELRKKHLEITESLK